MDSIDPGALLASMSGAQSASKAPIGNVDAQIMQLLQQTAPPPDAGTNQSTQNAQIASSVTPKGGNKLTTWLKNAPAAAGGGLYQMYEGLRGKSMDPLTQAVFDQARNAAPGAAPAAQTLATLPATMAAPEALGAAGLSRLAASPVGLGAVQGGIQGLMTAPPGQRLQQGLLGAATGAALPLAGAGLGKLASGLSRTPDAQALIDRGVTLTPGQLNSGGLWNKIEQGLTALPFVGGKIANARAAALPQVTRSILSDALAPGDKLATGDLNALVDNMQGGFDNAYSAVHGFGAKPAIVNVKGPDVPLSNAFQAVADKPRLGLTLSERQGMGQQLQDQLNETIQVARQNGGMLSDHLQALRSQIRTASRNATEPAERDLWNDAQQQVTKALESQLPPKAAAALSATDQQYAKFAIVQKAIAAGKDNAPTLSQLSTAVKQATPAKLYAAGGGWARDVTKAATGVLGNTVPMTGLTGAGIAGPAMHGLEGMLGAGAGYAGLSHPLSAIGAGAGLGSLWGAYTRPGMRALAGQTGPQKAVMGLMNSINPQVKKAGSLGLRAAMTQGLLQAPTQ